MCSHKCIHMIVIIAFFWNTKCDIAHSLYENKIDVAGAQALAESYIVQRQGVKYSSLQPIYASFGTHFVFSITLLLHTRRIHATIVHVFC